MRPLVTEIRGDHLVFIERDNRTGAFTEIKNLVRVSLDEVFDVDGITRDEKQRVDLIGPLRATNGWITDKPEGFAGSSGFPRGTPRSRRR